MVAIDKRWEQICMWGSSFQENKVGLIPQSHVSTTTTTTAPRGAMRGAPFAMFRLW